MLIDRLPSFLQEIAEFKELTDAEQPEFDEAAAAVRDLPSELFIFTMGEMGVSRWEKILNIPSKATETLEERRDRIVMKLMAQIPYTYRRLLEMLEQTCGKDGFKVELDAANYSLTVKVAVTRAANFPDVVELVENIAPANLLVTVMQLYFRWRDYSSHTWDELSAYTWQQLKEEGIK